MTVKDLLKFSVKAGVSNLFVDFNLYNYKGYKEVTYRMHYNIYRSTYYAVYLNSLYFKGGNIRV